jgi:hypothetical protein
VHAQSKSVRVCCHGGDTSPSNATYNDRANRSVSPWQCTCPFYSSRAGFFGKASHHPGLATPPQPKFCSLRLLAFPKATIAIEMEVICECDSHTVHKLSQRCLIADWLAPQESDCLQMHSKVSSDWLPSYIRATFPDGPLLVGVSSFELCSILKMIFSWRCV